MIPDQHTKCAPVDGSADESSQPPEIGVIDEVLIDGGYGWICVIAVLLINAHSWGIQTSYSVFLSYYLQNSTLTGASNLHYVFIGGLNFSMPFAVSPLATRIIGTLGTRICLLIGVVLQLGSLLGASFATHIWHLYLGQAVGFSWGIGFLFVGTLNVIPQWFERRRGLATGLAAAGTGLGGLCYSIASGHMLNNIGVNWSIRILAIVAGVVNLVASLLIRDRNESIKPSFSFFNVSLLRKPSYLILVAFSFFNMLGEIIILTQIPDYGSTALHLNITQASIIGSMVAMGQIIGRATIGYLSDHFGRLNVASAVTFCAGLWTLAVWTTASSYGLLIFYAICIGAFAGSFWSIIAPVSAEVLGLKLLPDGLSMMFIILVLPTTFSPVIARELVYEEYYVHAQVFAGVMFLASAAACWALRAWKVTRTMPANIVADADSHNGGLEGTWSWAVIRGLFCWGKA